MLLTITTTRYTATDLGYLLHKHPAKVQSVPLKAGTAHIFYPQATEDKCTAALLLDIDPIRLVRSSTPGNNDFVLDQYVNDRPYVASSFMSAAIAQAYSSAMNGRCKDKPELVDTPFPFEVSLSVLPVRGGETLLRGLFEPLGYDMQLELLPLDEHFPEWGQSRYFKVTLKATTTLKLLLCHLYILIPVCDNDKHYFVNEHEVEKLMEKGQGWLDTHPMKDLITRRYLRHRSTLTRLAMDQLLQEEAVGTKEEEAPFKEKVRLHDQRLLAVRDTLVAAGVKTVADLGCGEGKLLRLLIDNSAFTDILGMDVSHHSLKVAAGKLKLERMPEHQRQRITLIQGALTYRDKRIAGFEAATLVEVIEHLDENRLPVLEKVVFEYARPGMVIITTVNADYNEKYEKLSSGAFRHSDHRFEWSRARFESWAGKVAEQFGYAVRFQALGEIDPQLGGPSQMAVFNLSSL